MDRPHNATIKKLASRIHILRALKYTLSKKFLIQIYAAYFLSRLDSLSPILQLLTKKDVEKINAIVKRAHRIICGHDSQDNCLPQFSIRCSNIVNQLFIVITNNESHIYMIFSQNDLRKLIDSSSPHQYQLLFKFVYHAWSHQSQ